jgi:organic radical activating enzyme
MDVKITNYCDMGCPYCHENSTIKGLHGDILQKEFINTLTPFTEMAIGGGNPLSHPDLIEFLELLKAKNIIANITVNQNHLIQDLEKVTYLIDNKLIHGLGVSLTKSSDEFIDIITKFPNAVIHVINGIVSEQDIKKLYNLNLKVLILGYKTFRKGIDYYCQEVEDNKTMLYNLLSEMTKRFKVVSFDNLALKQLETRRLLSDSYWERFYMGDDGQFTMYVDLVDQKFARNSISNVRYDLLNDISDMLAVVKNEME